MTVGERIRSLRLQKNLSLTEVALRIDTPKQNLYKYENNIITNIPSNKIELLAEILDTSPAYIMGWSDNKYNTSNHYTDKEKEVIEAYREHPEMQQAVDKMLDIGPHEWHMREEVTLDKVSFKDDIE